MSCPKIQRAVGCKFITVLIFLVCLFYAVTQMKEFIANSIDIDLPLIISVSGVFAVLECVLLIALDFYFVVSAFCNFIVKKEDKLVFYYGPSGMYKRFHFGDEITVSDDVTFFQRLQFLAFHGESPVFKLTAGKKKIVVCVENKDDFIQYLVQYFTVLQG